MGARGDADRGPDESASAPAEGVAWRPPHGYSQHVAWDGSAVVKTFSPATIDRRRHELAALRAVGHVIPAPHVLPTDDPATVRLSFVPGILGEEWVAHNGYDRIQRHVRLMQQCGDALRRLHDLGRAPLADEIPGEGPVVVHGDFAPYNLILDPETGELQAVIDWELVHFGSTVEDLAWLEWNMRIWYSPEPRVFEALYEAYGSLPAWEDRHRAMIERCAPHLEAARRLSFPTEIAERWVAHMERTYDFEEVVGHA